MCLRLLRHVPALGVWGEACGVPRADTPPIARNTASAEISPSSSRQTSFPAPVWSREVEAQFPHRIPEQEAENASATPFAGQRLFKHLLIYYSKKSGDRWGVCNSQPSLFHQNCPTCSLPAANGTVRRTRRAGVSAAGHSVVTNFCHAPTCQALHFHSSLLLSRNSEADIIFFIL